MIIIKNYIFLPQNYRNVQNDNVQKWPIDQNVQKYHWRCSMKKSVLNNFSQVLGLQLY